MENYIVAIDLGTTKIVALIGEKTDYGRYRILASCELKSAGIVRGEVENLADVTELVKQSVDELRKESGLEFSEVYVGIAGQHIRCLCESVRELRRDARSLITQDEIDALREKMYSIRMEPGEEILHVIPQNYNVDDRMDIKKPVGMLGKELTGNYHIIMGRTGAIDTIKQCLSNGKVNIKLNRLILEPLASAAAVLTDEEKELGVALVDIGGGTTDMVVYYDNTVRHSAVIPFGGNIVTRDIRDGCRISMQTAESLKIKYGSCLGYLSSDNVYFSVGNKSDDDNKEISSKVLSRIIDARMGEILKAVKFELELSGFADKLNAGIVFTGGGSMLANFKQFAEMQTGLESRIGKPVYLSSDSGIYFAQPFYSTAIGLIIKGAEYEENKQKLEPITVPEIVHENTNTQLQPNIEMQTDTKISTKKRKKTGKIKLPDWMDDLFQISDTV
ncbi:MAG: cell division protein FtsA [Prevotellaceae bacterium]|jgi:cell division protein FtsA|nr:cell division protein FtsA [Prevotellaceae bacterium]